MLTKHKKTETLMNLDLNFIFFALRTLKSFYGVKKIYTYYLFLINLVMYNESLITKIILPNNKFY
jgi:hypothetical protein